MGIKSTFFVLFFVVLLPWRMAAHNFDTYFCDSTLRLDYIFAGKVGDVKIYSEELNLLSGWAGRRARLDSLPLQGNGQLEVRDKESKRLIYTTSFSSLFQEWLTTEEAKSSPRAFENVFLIPLPRHEVIIEMRLQDTDGNNVANLKHTVNPKDILIHHRF